MKISLSNILGLGLGLLLAGCSTAAQQSPGPAAADVVASAGDVSFTLSQIDEKALQIPASNFGNLKLSNALYEARRAAVEELITNTLLDAEAKKRGVDKTALIDQEITARAAPVTEAEVTSWYQTNPQRVQGAPLDQVRAPIRSLLMQQRLAAARDTFMATLKAKTPVKVLLDPPRTPVKAENAPATGAKDAPIELIEWADFECPFCLTAAPTVKQVMDTYGDRIRFVYRHYPLPNHPRAKPAAEASMCANEQGKFFPYHDRLFAAPGKLGDADLRQAAVDLGLDAAAFNKCVDERRYAALVEADAMAGNNVGVSGTPAFFINGRLLSGAQPFEMFKQVIDDELARKK